MSTGVNIICWWCLMSMWCCVWSCTVGICIDIRSVVLIVVCCVYLIASMYGECNNGQSFLWSVMPRSSRLGTKQLSQIDPRSDWNSPPPRWVGKFRYPSPSPWWCSTHTRTTSHLCTCLLHHINYIIAHRDVSCWCWPGWAGLCRTGLC